MFSALRSTLPPLQFINKPRMIAKDAGGVTGNAHSLDSIIPQRAATTFFEDYYYDPKVL